MTEMNMEDMAAQIKRLTTAYEVEKLLTNAALGFLVKTGQVSERRFKDQLATIDRAIEGGKDELKLLRSIFVDRLKSLDIQV